MARHRCALPGHAPVKNSGANLVCMSAYSAIKNGDLYYLGSSDEESEQVSGADSRQQSEEVVAPVALPFDAFLLDLSNHQITDTGMILGLRINETVKVRGQYRLTVVKGVLSVDGVLFRAAKRHYNVIAPNSHGYCQLTAVSKKERAAKVPEMLEGFLVVLRLDGFFTGLETIGRLCPMFKNLFQEEPLKKDVVEVGLGFPGLLVLGSYGSFDVLAGSSSLAAVPWIPIMDQLINQQCRRVLVLGYKNSGKSTFVKTFLNQYLVSSNFMTSVGVLDIDPGQVEYSLPNCVSYSKHSQAILGVNLATQQHTYESFHNEYFGFNNPLENPSYYLQLVGRLYKQYHDTDNHLQVPLIVNMPGWIKGSGVDLIASVVRIIKPTDIVYLSGRDVEDEVLKVIDHSKTIHAKGVQLNYDTLKYSSQDLSVFKLLTYFHRQHDNSFDYTPLLDQPVRKVSYGETGISSVVVIQECPHDQENLDIVLSCSVVAIYGVDLDEYLTVEISSTEVPLMSFTAFKELHCPKFLGLAIVHSVNFAQRYFSFYLTKQVLEAVTAHRDTHKLVIVRGKTSVPVWEISPVKFFKNEKIPYINFHDKFGKGGVVNKVRRNIKRRIH